MMQRLRGIVRVWDASGVLGVARGVRRHLWERMRFVQFRMDLDAWTPVPPPAPLEFRKGLPDLIKIRERADRALPVQCFQDEMHGASRPYMGLWEGELGHLSWLFTEGGHGRRLDLVDLGPRDVEIDGAFTFRAFRGRKLLTYVQHEMMRDARRGGARFAYTHVEEDNVPAIRGVLAAGYAAHGVVTSYRFLGFQWRTWEPAGSTIERGEHEQRRVTAPA